jgi:trehalose-phosphatase
MAAVRRLARFGGVEVALVSGRALDSLRATSGVSDEDALSLIGSHGAEAVLRHGLGARAMAESLAEPLAEAMTPASTELLQRVVAALHAIVEDGGGDGPGNGLEVETKPTGAVLHTRRAPADIARRATEQALAGPGTWPGVHVTEGKAVIELAVIEVSKGAALQHLRRVIPVDGVLYVGDDVTDESAFAVLGPADVSVKVGPGPTRAAYRLAGPEDVLELLQLLVAERSQR